MRNELCCCEYINEEGEKSHVIASLCNCNAIDEAFDRICTCKELRPGLCNEICNTIEDRLRIPWLGGAKQVSLYIYLALTILPALIYLGSLNHASTVVAYLIVMPFSIYICHRCIRNRVSYYKQTVTDNQHLSVLKAYRFYSAWFVSSVFLSLFSIYILIFDTLKISSMESLALISLCTFSCCCFYVTAKVQTISVEECKNSLVDVEEYIICNACHCRVPREALHCKYCDACVLYRDHHCLWLSTCIHKENDRWFVVGLSLFCGYLIFHAYLTFTTVCQPRKVYLVFGEILYPYYCHNMYFDFSHAFATSVGCYVLLVTAYVCAVLVHQLFKISAGKRRPKIRKNRFRRLRPEVVWNVLFNWYTFCLT